MVNILSFDCSFGHPCLLGLTRLPRYHLILTYGLFTSWYIKILFFLFLKTKILFDVIRKYTVIINPNRFFMLFS